VALVLFGREQDPARRRGIDRSGPCVGGPELGKDATVRPDGTAVFPCSISGTATITVDKQ
jgi:hypothetical protein